MRGFLREIGSPAGGWGGGPERGGRYAEGGGDASVCFGAGQAERKVRRRALSCAVASRWQRRHRVRRLSRSHWPPPSATGRIWSASQRVRRAVMVFMP